MLRQTPELPGQARSSVPGWTAFQSVRRMHSVILDADERARSGVAVQLLRTASMAGTSVFKRLQRSIEMTKLASRL